MQQRLAKDLRCAIFADLNLLKNVGVFDLIFRNQMSKANIDRGINVYLSCFD